MINFFRKIRKKMADDNKPLKYMRYAIGEILLVVIGILIALSINNWNEGRKNRERFDFGLKELYNKIQVDVYSYSTLKERLEFQLARMDSILEGKQIMYSEHLPGILQIFDELGIENKIDNYEWQKSYLEFNPNDDRQNEKVRSLRTYLSDSNIYFESAIDLNLSQVMMKYLQQNNIPVRSLTNGQGYSHFITNFSKDFYTEKNIEQVLKLIQKDSFLADLKSLRAMKINVLNNIDVITVSGKSVLTHLRNQNPKLQFGIRQMEIIGSGTILKGWTIGIEMQKDLENAGVWQIDTELFDGELKFRTDGNWSNDWGLNESNPNKLMFKGANIIVKEGHYLVKININENTYEFIKLDD